MGDEAGKLLLVRSILLKSIFAPYFADSTSLLAENLLRVCRFYNDIGDKRCRPIDRQI